jgi:hypothetical protein
MRQLGICVPFSELRVCGGCFTAWQSNLLLFQYLLSPKLDRWACAGILPYCRGLMYREGFAFPAVLDKGYQNTADETKLTIFGSQSWRGWETQSWFFDLATQLARSR